MHAVFEGQKVVLAEPGVNHRVQRVQQNDYEAVLLLCADAVVPGVAWLVAPRKESLRSTIMRAWVYDL